MSFDPPYSSNEPSWLEKLRRRLSLPERPAEHWIALLLANDLDAWTQVHLLVYDACARNLRARGFTEQDWDEVSQDVLLAVDSWVKGPDPQIKGIFESYIVRIVTNKCIDRGRSRSRQLETIPYLNDTDQADYRVEVPVEAIRGGQIGSLEELLWELVNICITRLPKKQRETTQHYLDGHGPAAICAIENIPGKECTVAKRWSDGRVNINRFLDACLQGLDPFPRLIFYLYIDRSKRLQETGRRVGKVVPQPHQEESSSVRCRSITWILEQLRAVAKALGEQHVPQLPRHENEPLQLAWGRLTIPDPLTADDLDRMLRTTLAGLISCVGTSLERKTQ